MNKIENIPTLFSEEELPALPATEKRSREENFNDYDGFVEKFKPKKTTDDCYTPAHIYDAILDWARANCRIPEDANIVRPFYPGGDYRNYPYKTWDVVVDNPPFSIITAIKSFYMERGIPFFLFAPHLTLLSSFRNEENVTFIVANASIVYENGANVNTDFITNLWPEDDAVVVAGDLNEAIAKATKANATTKDIPKYIYPPCVASSAHLGKLAARGLTMRMRRKEVQWISKLDSQRPQKKTIFGGGLLISERLAAERLAAERLAEKASICWELSEREKEIVKGLG